MNKILDMIAKWDHFGQGVFFLLLTGAVVSAAVSIAKYIAIMICGWPK